MTNNDSVENFITPKLDYHDYYNDILKKIYKLPCKKKYPKF